MTYFFSLLILLPISMLSVLSQTSPAYGAPEYRYHVCPNDTTIPENGSYQSSLISLLSSISLYATRDFQFYSPATSSLTSSLFSNAISKLQKLVNISDPIYALHLCRGDLTTEECRDCVATAAKSLIEEFCPRELVAVIWYDECMIRYSNASFFSTMDTVPSVPLSNIENITEQERSEQERFNQLVNTTMIDLASQASEVPAGSNKFATKEVNFSELQKIYSLVQCTPDLSTTDCNRCLGTAIGYLHECCSGKRGGNVLMPSCHVRYALFQFYKIIDTAPSPAPTLPPLPPREPEDKSQIPTVSIFAIVAPIVASVVLFFLA